MESRLFLSELQTAHEPKFALARSPGAFTLIEVILAIGIATGILMVALVFYQQAAHLRSQLIDEAERLSSIRLIMDRVTADLHSAFEQPQVGFTGGTDSMEFVTARSPEFSLAGSLEGPSSDLRRISYYLTASLEGTNFVITGLDRTDDALLAKPVATSLAEAGSTSDSTVSVSPAPIPIPSATEGTNQMTAPSEPLAESIRFARFRYWDGAAWLEAWDAPDLPQAVEVSLGAEPLPADELPDAYPYELFRRVIVLPVHSAAGEDWWAGL